MLYDWARFSKISVMDFSIVSNNNYFGLIRFPGNKRYPEELFGIPALFSIHIDTVVYFRPGALSSAECVTVFEKSCTCTSFYELDF